MAALAEGQVSLGNRPVERRIGKRNRVGHHIAAVAERVVKTTRLRARGQGNIRRWRPAVQMAEAAHLGIRSVGCGMSSRSASPGRRRVRRIDADPVATRGIQTGLVRQASGEVRPVTELAGREALCRGRIRQSLRGSAVRIGRSPASRVSRRTARMA